MAAPGTQQGMASGLLTTARYFGMMGGITLGSSVFDVFLKVQSHVTAGGYDLAFQRVIWLGVAVTLIGTGFAIGMRREVEPASARI